MYYQISNLQQHWLRRQIGSLLPEHRDHARNEWVTEEVRCVTASDVLSDWSSMTKRGTVVDGAPTLSLANEAAASTKDGADGRLV